MIEETGIDNNDISFNSSLTSYLQSIKKFPILEQAEEYMLAKEYKISHNPQVVYKLVTSHLRLVAKVVNSYRGYGLPVSELIAEGNIGLIQAVRKFDPDKGFRFSTYALWWIKASIQKYILNSWSLVKIGTTNAQKKLFFNLRKIKKQLNLMDDKEMDNNIINDIAERLSVSPKDVTEMNSRICSHDSSLNSLVNDDESDSPEVLDFVSDMTPNQEERVICSETHMYRKQAFIQALECLNPREKDILFKRRLYQKPITLEELSSVYNISKERVRQIEFNSINKIRKNIPTLQ